MAASSFSSLGRTKSPIHDQIGPCTLPSFTQFNAAISILSQPGRSSTINQLLSPLPNTFLDKIVSPNQSSGDYGSDCAGAGDNDLENGANTNIKNLGDTPFKKRKAQEQGRNDNKTNKVTSFSQPVSTRPQTPQILENSPTTLQRTDGFRQILTGMFQTLPSLSEDTKDEVGKFNWLLRDTEEDLLEIHDGCGVSTKLLHMISHTTYCAARMKQEPTSFMVPITAKYLDQGFSEFPQWTDSVGDPRANMAINRNPVMSSNATEAWDCGDCLSSMSSFEVCVYKKGLPRNHPDVIANLEDLSKCIRIMLTSSPQLFTQVPPLPAFLLGMLATTSDHRSVSDDVLAHIPLKTHKKSIQRIWERIAEEVEAPPEPMIIDKHIHTRSAWWEEFVASFAKGKRQKTCLGLMFKLSISG